MSLLSSIEKAVLKHRRKTVAKELFAKHYGVIQRGPFKGMSLNGVANISQAAHGLKIYGLYEEPVLSTILEWGKMEAVVDVGAGDGYYPVGMLKNALVKRAICFEITESGQTAIQKNADLNGVGDGVEIFGAADASLPEKMDELNLPKDQTVFLCDIEGAEFSHITKELIEGLSGAKFIIELHEPLVNGDNETLRSDLLSRFPENYETYILRDRPRPWNGISDLEDLHDLDRALVTCEGRKFIGEWLIAEPKTKINADV